VAGVDFVGQDPGSPASLIIERYTSASDQLPGNVFALKVNTEPDTVGHEERGRRG
jgi:hypothetical protein